MQKGPVGDSLELWESNSHRRSGRDTDKTVLSCLAWRCEFSFKGEGRRGSQAKGRKTASPRYFVAYEREVSWIQLAE